MMIKMVVSGVGMDEYIRSTSHLEKDYNNWNTEMVPSL